MQLVTFVKTDGIRAKADAFFSTEKEKLLKLFPFTDIQHVGSTAVPGTLSKGDVDINVRVSAEKFETVVQKLKTLYEVNQSNNWTSSFASFKDDGRELGIQVISIGSPDDYFVAQRDYLKSHPAAVLEYNALKEKFEGGDMDIYRKAKGEFLKKLLELI